MTLAELIEQLERAVDRAESEDWTALVLTVAEARALLPDLKRCASSADPQQKEDV
jgi:hypothetical protein